VKKEELEGGMKPTAKVLPKPEIDEEDEGDQSAPTSSLAPTAVRIEWAELNPEQRIRICCDAYDDGGYSPMCTDNEDDVDMPATTVMINEEDDTARIAFARTQFKMSGSASVCCKIL
jgi:hypothetical protein